MARLLWLKERSKPFRFLDHLFQFAGFSIHIGVHFQWSCDGGLLLEAPSHPFQVSVESRFGFLYCRVYGVSVGLEGITLCFAG